MIYSEISSIRIFNELRLSKMLKLTFNTRLKYWCPHTKVFFRWHKCVLGDKAFENSRSLTEPEREKNSYSRLHRTASVVTSLLTETS